MKALLQFLKFMKTKAWALIAFILTAIGLTALLKKRPTTDPRISEALNQSTHAESTIERVKKENENLGKESESKARGIDGKIKEIRQKQSKIAADIDRASASDLAELANRKRPGD